MTMRIIAHGNLKKPVGRTFEGCNFFSNDLNDMHFSKCHASKYRYRGDIF
jgi:hypothetical protein